MPDMKFHRNYACEKDQYAKPCQKLSIYQVLQIEYLQT